MATLAHPIQTSFNGGEFSLRVQGRVDQEIYDAGLATMENFLTTVEGPALKRSGFLHVNAAAATAARLTEFRFNRTQTYIEEWLDTKVRFYTNNARIETAPDVAYEVLTPYTAAQVANLWIQQSFDRQYLAHTSHEPHRLTRTGALTFALGAVPFTNGPFGDLNRDDSITVTVSATTGAGITITATSAIFTAGHVGSLFRIEAKDFSTIPAWEPGIDSNTIGVTKRRSDGKVYIAASTGRTGTIQPTHAIGTEWDGSQGGTDINAKGPYGVQWTYLHDLFGIVRITAVAGDGLSATATVIRRLPDTLTSIGSPFWTHGAFSAAAGWPGIVFLWQGRLCWIKERTIYGSVAGDLLNHQQFTTNGLLAPDLAFSRQMDITEDVLWARPDRAGIYLGTASGEYLIDPLNPNEGVNGNNIKLLDQGNRGSEPVQPVKVGGEVMFVERGGVKIRAAEYAFDRDRYPAANLTQLARHITGSGVHELIWMQNPEQLLIAVRDDGMLAVHAHDPEQQIKGWSRVALAAGGAVKSAVSTSSPDGRQDDLWAIVERDGVKSIERLMPSWDEDRSDPTQPVFVDSAVLYTGPATDTLSAPHLAGRTVRVVAAGAEMPDMVVAADGTIGPLPKAATPLVAGLGYAATLKSLRFEQRDRYGQTNQGFKKRIASLLLRVIDTAQVGVKAGNFLQKLISRSAADAMDTAIPLYTGDTLRLAAGGDWGKDGQFEIVSDNALPCMVVAALPEVSVSQ